MTPALGRIAWALVLFSVGVILGLWIPARPTAPIGAAVEATQAQELKGASTETIPCAPVKVYTSPAKKKLALPEAVQDNPNLQVTASIRLPADLYQHRITSVIDTGTGETNTYDQRLALPWLSADSRGEAGIIYGMRGRDRVVRLEARQAIADIKAVKFGAVASLDHPLSGASVDGYVGVGAWYRW